eukprot:SAG11_NODE_7671_length_1112_cov_1.235933_1_plen_285_part_01
MDVGLRATTTMVRQIGSIHYGAASKVNQFGICKEWPLDALIEPTPPPPDGSAKLVGLPPSLARHLFGMRLGALRKLAAAKGVASEELATAAAAPNPRVALVSLITGTPVPDATARSHWRRHRHCSAREVSRWKRVERASVSPAKRNAAEFRSARVGKPPYDMATLSGRAFLLGRGTAPGHDTGRHCVAIADGSPRLRVVDAFRILDGAGVGSVPRRWLQVQLPQIAPQMALSPAETAALLTAVASGAERDFDFPSFKELFRAAIQPRSSTVGGLGTVGTRATRAL